TIEKYSTDALRFTLAVLAVQGRDIKLSDDKLEQSRNFTNKLFNATNFLQLNQEHFDDLNPANIKTPLGRYMLARFNVAVKETREFMDVYRFNDAATVLYRFLWGEFCDWGIELSKADKASVAELGSIFKESMKLLHPFMPFITENLYMRLSSDSLEEGESIMVKSYPTVSKADDEVMKQFDLIMEAIVSVRRCKTLIDKGNQKIEKASIKLPSASDEAMMKPFIEKLGKVEELTFVEAKIDNCVTDVSDNMETFISTDDIDMSAIIAKLTKQKEKLEKEIAKLNGMLNNERFVANAPEKVIAENRQTLADAMEKMAKVEAELQGFG
ncbi:MAG TPA: valine--tRNA ligase, partial [Campylobacterales bacterium]|nr:valine--tRNA ligase [Campylobacterales bacterium]